MTATATYTSFAEEQYDAAVMREQGLTPAQKFAAHTPTVSTPELGQAFTHKSAKPETMATKIQSMAGEMVLQGIAGAGLSALFPGVGLIGMLFNPIQGTGGLLSPIDAVDAYDGLNKWARNRHRPITAPQPQSPAAAHRMKHSFPAMMPR